MRCTFKGKCKLSTSPDFDLDCHPFLAKILPYSSSSAITPEKKQIFCLKQFDFIKIINALVTNGYKVIRQQEETGAGAGAVRKLCVSLQLTHYN